MTTAATIEVTDSAPPTDRLVTGEELLQHPEWGNCELIRGEVVKLCRPNSAHGRIVTRLANKLDTFVEARKLGMVFSDAGIYLERDPDTVRGPDLHIIRAENCPSAKAMQRYLEIAPDLCIEVVSPSDTWSKLEEKIDQYLSIGVTLVWAIEPSTRTARIYRKDGASERLSVSGRLSGESVLPGFELPLKELFAALDLPKSQ